MIKKIQDNKKQSTLQKDFKYDKSPINLTFVSSNLITSYFHEGNCSQISLKETSLDFLQLFSPFTQTRFHK
jgi:hypothetical protein